MEFVSMLFLGGEIFTYGNLAQKLYRIFSKCLWFCGVHCPLLCMVGIENPSPLVVRTPIGENSALLGLVGTKETIDVKILPIGEAINTFFVCLW